MKIPFIEIQYALLTEDTDLSSFSCGDDEIDSFLADDAKEYQKDRIATTYLAYHNGELVGFFSLANGCISAEAVESRSGESFRPKKYPALKIAQLGTCKRFQGRDVGKHMLKIIIGIALSLGKYVGCRVILVDSKQDPRLIHFYHDYGLFERFGDGSGETIPFMRDIKKIDTHEGVDQEITEF